MKNAEDKRQAVRHSFEEIRQIIAEFESSGLGREEFARSDGFGLTEKCIAALAST